MAKKQLAGIRVRVTREGLLEATPLVFGGRGQLIPVKTAQATGADVKVICTEAFSLFTAEQNL